MFSNIFCWINIYCLTKSIMMKFFSSKTTQLVLLGIVLVLSIIVSILNTPNILPYSPVGNYSNFEGFDTPDTKSTSSPPTSGNAVVPSGENILNGKKFAIEDINNLKNLMSSIQDTDTKKKPDNSGSGSGSTPTSNTKSNNIEPFTLSPSPIDSNELFDRYSGLEGSPICEPSPYSNSMGYICMNPQDKNLLLTRGGNQTGGV